MLKILIVDDNQKRSKRIVDSIEASTFNQLVTVATCISADSARLELLSQFDLLILDVVLPKKNDSTPQPINSANLLKDLYNPNKKFLKPNLIIGLTAETQELDKYKDIFSESFTIVLDGSMNTNDWLNRILYSIESLLGNKKKSIANSTDKTLITIHGIRTYGKWQKQLKDTVNTYSRDFSHIEIKYGFFDIISFSIPYFRDRRAQKTAERLNKILGDNLDKRIYIVAHSYGTYILSKALHNFTKEKAIKAIILCGSPLSHSQCIDHIVTKADVTINECGTKDYILILARLFIIGLGDAGRTGFSRENTMNFMNRFHSGGHSLYFSEKEQPTFYDKYWTPILSTDAEPAYCDSRANYPGEDLAEILIKAVSLLKPYAYFLSALAAGYFYWGS